MRLTLIHNPTAGTGEPSAAKLTDLLRGLGHEVRYQSRKDEGLEEAIAAAADAIVLAGGDGTVSKLLTLLADRGLPIAILPLGTANNIAAALGTDGPAARVAAGWAGGAQRRLDLGRAHGGWGERLFVDSAGTGVVSAAMLEMHRADTPSGGNKLQQARRAVRRHVAEAEPRDFGLVADGTRLPPDLLLAEVMNLPRLGPGLCVAPDTDPSDGMLDLVFIRAGDRGAMLDWLDAGATGPAPATTLRAGSLRIDRPFGLLRIGDAFEEGAGQSVVEASGRFLTVLVPDPQAITRGAGS